MTTQYKAQTAAPLKSGRRPAVRRVPPAAAWAVGGLALFAVLLRISLGSPTIADGAKLTRICGRWMSAAAAGMTPSGGQLGRITT